VLIKVPTIGLSTVVPFYRTGPGKRKAPRGETSTAGGERR
jgi:hypothetical protein